MSETVIDLISQLVTKPEKRLGKNGAEEIKMHSWFKGVKWNDIKKMMPPFIPEVKDEIDTKYFDDYDEN